MSAKGLKSRQQMRADLEFEEHRRELLVQAGALQELLDVANGFSAAQARPEGGACPDAGGVIGGNEASPAVSFEAPPGTAGAESLGSAPAVCS